MIIYRAYKFRMYPDSETIPKLNSFMGASRFIYNYYLTKKDEYYKKNKKNYKLNDMKEDAKHLHVEYPWLKDIDNAIIRTTLKNLESNYIGYLKGRAKHPKYKKKNDHGTYRTNAIGLRYNDRGYHEIKVDLKNHTIQLPMLPKIKIRGYRNLESFDDKKIINATISQVGYKYYVSVAVEENITVSKFIPKNVVGIDIGVKNLIVTSDNVKYSAMQDTKALEKRIKGLNRALARSKDDSKNRDKLVKKIQRLNQKSRNIRKYYTHYLTSKLVKENDIIVAESLDVKDMIENSLSKSLRKHILNSTFSEILRQLDYKCAWNNKRFVQVDRYFKSSQICSNCGYVYKETKNLNVRKWECPNCHSLNDRDINASINIKYEGIKKYFENHAE